MAGLGGILGIPGNSPAPRVTQDQDITAEVAPGTAAAAANLGGGISGLLGAPAPSMLTPRGGNYAQPVDSAPGIGAAIGASMSPGPAMPRARGIVGDMAELAGMAAQRNSPVQALQPVIPTEVASNPLAATLNAAAAAKSQSVLGGPGPNPMASAAGQMADPLAALRSRQFSDGFNFPGF